jgi:hypothetical protein
VPAWRRRSARRWLLPHLQPREAASLVREAQQMIERDVKRPLKKLLDDLGAYQFWPVQMGYGSTTIDVLFCWHGQFYGVETKRPGVDHATVSQMHVMGLIETAGGQCCLENDPALPAVKRMLDLF